MIAEVLLVIVVPAIVGVVIGAAAAALCNLMDR